MKTRSLSGDCSRTHAGGQKQLPDGLARRHGGGGGEEEEEEAMFKAQRVLFDVTRSIYH